MEEEFADNFIRQQLVESIYGYACNGYDVKLRSYEERVEKMLNLSVKVYLRQILCKMVKHKRKYTIKSPAITGKGYDPTDNYIKTKAVYDETPFTAADMFECMKPLSHSYPKRDVYQLALLRVLNKRREGTRVKKEEKPEEKVLAL